MSPTNKSTGTVVVVQAVPSQLMCDTGWVGCLPCGDAARNPGSRRLDRLGLPCPNPFGARVNSDRFLGVSDYNCADGLRALGFPNTHRPWLGSMSSAFGPSSCKCVPPRDPFLPPTADFPDVFPSVGHGHALTCVAQDYAKYGVTKMEDKQKLFRLIKSLNSNSSTNSPQKPSGRGRAPPSDGAGARSLQR